MIVFGIKNVLKRNERENILGLNRIFFTFTGIRMECLKLGGAARDRVTCFILCKN